MQRPAENALFRPLFHHEPQVHHQHLVRDVADDPQVVAPMLDAMLLVVEEGGPPRDEIASAAKLLAEFNLLGVVLNKSVERGEKGYYDY